MQRNMYEQALRMHGQSLALFVEENQKENFVFFGEEHHEHGAVVAAFCDRQPTASEAESAPSTLPHGGGRLTGTLRDLVQPHIDSNTEDSRSDVSPDILPLGVPRELHEPFELDSSKEVAQNQKQIHESQKSAEKPTKRGEFTSILQEFIGKKADLLFKLPNKGDDREESPHVQDTEDLDYYAILPPMEQFMHVPPDQARKRVFDILKVGDILAGSIIAIKEFGMFVRVVFVCGKESRYIENCDVVGLLPKGELGERYSKKARLDNFHVRDLIRGVVMKTDAANEKVILTLNPDPDDAVDVPLGIISESELPVCFRRSRTQLETRESYDDMLHNTLGFDNPNNVAYLAKMVHIDDMNPPSLMRALQSDNFSEKEHAEALRKWQSHKWSMESVAKGVEHFKSSRHLEAMQQLNRALEIDAENVEGLVARGALFANQDDLSKAIKDFAKALQIKPIHKNANKYMCETLMEKGKQCEESGDTEKAIDCYQSVVDLNADLLEAQTSLQRLMKATKRKNVNDDKRTSDDSAVSISDESPPLQMSAKELRQMIDDEGSKSVSKKKKKKKNKHKRESVDGKGDKKSRKERKKAKKKRESRGSVSPEAKSVHAKKKSSSESSASDSDSSISSLPKQNKTKVSRGDDKESSSSDEVNQPISRKRSRNESVSPQRKSRSKTRKAHQMLLKKVSGASTISSSEDESQYTQEPGRVKSKERPSLESKNISQSHEQRGKTARKKDKRGSSESSDHSSRSSEGNRQRTKQTKIDRKSVKDTARKKDKRGSSESSNRSSQSPEGNCHSVKETKVSRKSVKDTSVNERDLKHGRKTRNKQKSSPQHSDESPESIRDSPTKKQSRHLKRSAGSKRPKESDIKFKKLSESATSSSSDSDSVERAESPPAKIRKKKNKKHKKKKKRERSVSSSSSSSPVPKNSKTESAKKKKKKRKKHRKAHAEETPSKSRSESPKSLKYKPSPEETNVRRRSSRKSGISPEQDGERSRSSSKCSSKRDQSLDKSYGDVKSELESRSRRSISIDSTKGGIQGHSKKRSARTSGSLSPQGHRHNRKRSPERKSDDRENLDRKRKGSVSSQVSSVSGNVDKTDETKGGSKSKEKSDKSKVRQNRSKSPQEDSQRNQSGERRSEHETKRKSGESRKRKSSHRSNSQSPISEKQESRKALEHETGRKKGVSVSPTRNPPLSKRSRSKSRSLSPKGRKDAGFFKTADSETKGKSTERAGSVSPGREIPKRRSREGREITKEKRTSDQTDTQKRRLSSRSLSPVETSETVSPVRERQTRRSRDSKELDENKRSKADDHEARKRHSSSKSDHPEDEEANNNERRQNRKSDRNLSSPVSDKSNQTRSWKGRDAEQELKDTSVSQRDRKASSSRRSRSVEVERQDHERRLSGSKDNERKQSSDGRGRNRSGPIEEKRDISQDGQENEQVERRRSHESDRRRSGEHNRKSGENDRRQMDDGDVSRRASSDSKYDDRGSRDTGDNWNDRDRRRQSFDRPNESDRQYERRDERRRERRSRDREDRSRDRERRVSGEPKDSGRRSGQMSRHTSLEDRHREKSQERNRDRVSHDKGKSDKGKSYDRKGSDSVIHAKDYVSPVLNIKDIPMPPEAEVKAEVTKEPSPIKYVTSGTCKDEIIKVKSKWDTDSEDEDDTFGSSVQKKGRAGGSTTITNQSSQGQTSHGSSGQGGSGKGSGGYRWHADFIHDDMKSDGMTFQTCTPDMHIVSHGTYIFKYSELSSSSSRELDDDNVVPHAPLRLRGGCVASPPKLDDEFGSGDSSDESRRSSLSDITLSSSDSSPSRGTGKYSKSHDKVSRRISRSSSGSSSRSTSSKSHKRLKRGSSSSLSRSSSSDSSYSTSSRNSSRSSSSKSSDNSELRSRRSSNSNSSRDCSSRSVRRKQNESSDSEKSNKESERLKLEGAPENSDSEGSSSGSAGAYALWDSWEDYLESKGHHIAKTVTLPENAKQKLMVDDRPGDSDADSEDAVKKRRNKQKLDKKVDKSVPEAETELEPKSKISKSVSQSEKAKGSNSQSEKAKGSNSAKIPRTSRTVGMDRSSDPSESERHQDPNMSSQGDPKRHSHRHDRWDEQGGQSHRKTSYDSKGKLDDEQGSRSHRETYDDTKIEYANRSGPDRRRHFREEGPYRHHEHRYHSADEHRPYHQRGRRDFDYRSGYRGRHWDQRRNRYEREDDWGRGVTEIKERGVFFGLVRQCKNDLVNILYDVTRNLELLRSNCLKSRTWWL